MEQRRTNALCERLAGSLAAADGGSFGDRGERFLLRLARLRPLLRFARAELNRWLESTDLPPEVVSDATLACSEACANAIEHPSRPRLQRVEIEARHDDTQLVLRVRDYGSWSGRSRSDERGRGLDMIGRLMDAVDIRRHAEGTEIVMRRRLASRR